jgi:hypothetical protein
VVQILPPPGRRRPRGPLSLKRARQYQRPKVVGETTFAIDRLVRELVRRDDGTWSCRTRRPRGCSRFRHLPALPHGAWHSRVVDPPDPDPLAGRAWNICRADVTALPPRQAAQSSTVRARCRGVGCRIKGRGA